MSIRPSGPPRFAVVIPTYNRAAVVGRSVRSVLAQTIDDLELVVVVDGSTDDTLAVLAEVHDDRFRVVTQENSGVSSARNAGIEATSAELVAWFDDDDEADPQWLEKLGVCFDDPDCYVACCGMRRAGPPPPGFEPMKFPKPDSWHDFDTLFMGGTFMVRRSLLDTVGGFMPGLAFSENTELGLRLGDGVRALGGRMAAVHEPLVIKHSELSGTSRAHRADAVVQVLAQHPDRFADPHRRAQWLAIAGVAQARVGDLRGARRFFLRAWRARPIDLRHLGRYVTTWVPGLPRRRWAVPRVRS